MAIKSLSIRIDEEVLNKLHVVADYEGRSANGQILILIRDCIRNLRRSMARSAAKEPSAVGRTAFRKRVYIYYSQIYFHYIWYC